MVVASLEMLSGRSKKEYAQEAQAVAEALPHARTPQSGAYLPQLCTIDCGFPVHCEPDGTGMPRSRKSDRAQG